MNIKSNKCVGVINVSEDVIINIAENVIDEIDGVEKYNSRKNLKLGSKPAISVLFKDGAAEITALINTALECNVQKAAETVQEKIKSCVQDMTRVMVSKVNVKIMSVY